MGRYIFCAGAALLAFSATVNAATFRFQTDPFAGSTAPTTPGRQVVGNEDFITFDITSDIFSFDPVTFGVGDDVQFANGLVGNLPASGANVIVLQTTDNDNNPVTPFGAGNAADLIAGQVTTSGAGFFIYFNSGLNLPRLVFSTDLSDNTADLKILARMTNLTGQTSALPTFTQSNFDIEPVPEPSSLLLMSAAGVLWAGARFRVLRKSR
jgi:hypothetical protein